MLLLCLFLSAYAEFLADYSAYLHELLVSHFDLSLDLFQGDFWISSHYSLTPSNSLPPLNLNKFGEYCISQQYTHAAEVHLNRV